MAAPILTDPAAVDDHAEKDTLVDSAEAIEATHETVAQGERPDPINDFLDFEIYRVSNNAIVSRARHNVDQAQNEVTFQREDISYLGFEWVLRFSWVNETSSEHTYTRTVQEGLTIREGQETETNFGVSASFKGLGINAGGVRKHFSENETSRLESITKEVTVPANASLYFYQKQYNFSTTVWWGQNVSNWTEHNPFVVGINGGGTTITRTAVTSIFAEEYGSLLRRLNGTAVITADSVPSRNDEPQWRRQFVNITQRAKNWLQARGVTGSG